MYENYYGFRERPFSIVPNPDYLYLSPIHQNALTYLEYGLMEDIGFILLTGDVGTGKTTLIRYVINQFCSDMDVAVIFNTNVSADQLISLILRSYGLSSDTNDKVNALDILYNYLIEKYSENRRALIIIDEAQNLSHESLEEVRMLSNLQSDDHVLLQIMLVGQPELKAKLRHQSFTSITQRIAVKFHLSPLTRKEAGRYIAFRLEKAGGKSDLFDTEAVDMIYRESGGIPRSINLICDSALVYGFGYDLRTIGGPVIEQVVQDRGGLEVEMGPAVEEPYPFTATHEKKEPELIDRLRVLEAGVRKLQMQIEWQMGELDRRAEGFQTNLIGKLNDLLLKERKRSDNLLVEYSQLRVKYRALLKQRLRDKKARQNLLTIAERR
ncbi:MAG: AAA family ATPase [Proteobacteria bacterium]|nr:AAA family ATPase [Pseudomonadota bacterium]